MKPHSRKLGAIELTSSSMVVALMPKNEQSPTQERSLEKDILNAVMQANLLGAHGIGVKGIKLDAQRGFIVEPGQPYPKETLEAYRQKLELEVSNHKTNLFGLGVMERNLREKGEFTEKDFLKIIDDYDQGGSQN